METLPGVSIVTYVPAEITDRVIEGFELVVYFAYLLAELIAAGFTVSRPPLDLQLPHFLYESVVGPVESVYFFLGGVVDLEQGMHILTEQFDRLVILGSACLPGDYHIADRGL